MNRTSAARERLPFSIISFTGSILNREQDLDMQLRSLIVNSRERCKIRHELGVALKPLIPRFNGSALSMVEWRLKRSQPPIQLWPAHVLQPSSILTQT